MSLVAVIPANSGPLRFEQSEALLRKVLENAAVGMVLVGASGQIVYVNLAFAQMLGGRREQFLGLRLSQVLHADEHSLDQAFEALGRGSRESVETECLLTRGTGEALWVKTSASVLFDHDGQTPLYTIVQVTDIDGQKRAERALAESERRWNWALEGARQGVWDHHLRNGTVFYSPMWHMMRGFGPDEDVDAELGPWIDRMHPEDRKRIEVQIKQQNAGQLEYNAFEYRERHRDGHWMWILSRGKPLEWNADGTVARIAGTDTDITELKSVETALAEEKERLKVTLESIGDGVISTDAEGCISFMNPMAEAFTGWTAEEAIGKRLTACFSLYGEVTGLPAEDTVAECLGRGQTFYLDEDLVLVGRRGERRDIRASAAPVRSPDGSIVGAVVVFQDVTQSRSLQKKLAHSASHDALTGLPNRAAFETALADVVARAGTERREHALCFLDLDRFKIVNDTAGHAAGDALLKEIAKAIASGCRPQDFAARLGGDEFGLILADCTPERARMIARRLVDRIAAFAFTWSGRTYHVGASIGITAITPHSASETALVSQADMACYAVKAAGRGGVAIYEDK